MNTTKQQHAHALAIKAFGLYESGKQAEAFKVYRAAVAAGYKTPAEEEQERKDRESIQAAAVFALILTATAAAVAIRAGFFF
jgi:hypothetical protein